MNDKSPAINTSERLFDLVRYSRAISHEDGLISDEEYAWLCGGSPMTNSPQGGSPSPRRLEEYDEMRAMIEKQAEMLNCQAKANAEMRDTLSNLQDQRDCAIDLLMKAEAQIATLQQKLDKHQRERDETVKESTRTNEKWIIGIQECCGTKIKFDAIGDHSPPPTLDQFIKEIKNERDEAEKDAEQLAESALAMYKDLKLCYQAFLDQHRNPKRMSFTEGFELGKRLAQYWATENQALAAHEARKKKPWTLEDEFNLPKGSFLKFIEEHSHNLP